MHQSTLWVFSRISIDVIETLFHNRRLTLSKKQVLLLTCLQYKSFENTVGKGENALGQLSAIFNKFEMVVCKLFQFGRLKDQ